jgi:hypothetical protein
MSEATTADARRGSAGRAALAVAHVRLEQAARLVGESLVEVLGKEREKVIAGDAL